MAYAEILAVFTPVMDQRVLAAVMAMGGCKGRVILTSGGSLGVLDDTSDEMAARVGQVVSNFVKEMPVVVLDRRDGQISAVQWLQGVRGQSLPPGLALDSAPGVVLTLLSGSQEFDEVAGLHEDKVADARMSKWQAFRSLRAIAKDARGRMASGPAEDGSQQG
ncbi:hypothetical protein [Demequina capsici]|uniref:Uncharacterized protein n=1 Tax=Demequina capsici TaxID=3075620 RepID=A0AA96J9A7_9MICO|nr:hypothetical protein [Demequina sp. OYTSA14]WNM23326.1 hypothetical protein RN606_08090 [Demequina sp. OYTSA14]